MMNEEMKQEQLGIREITKNTTIPKVTSLAHPMIKENIPNIMMSREEKTAERGTERTILRRSIILMTTPVPLGIKEIIKITTIKEERRPANLGKKRADVL